MSPPNVMLPMLTRVLALLTRPKTRPTYPAQATQRGYLAKEKSSTGNEMGISIPLDFECMEREKNLLLSYCYIAAKSMLSLHTCIFLATPNGTHLLSLDSHHLF